MRQHESLNNVFLLLIRQVEVSKGLEVGIWQFKVEISKGEHVLCLPSECTSGFLHWVLICYIYKSVLKYLGFMFLCWLFFSFLQLKQFLLFKHLFISFSLLLVGFEG